jgi:pimeloyl-ACP methyl ester carboxylesterase
MRELSLAFGPNHSLIGTIVDVDRPDGPHDPIKPAIVFMNAGFTPRIGPNRFFVRLARLFGRQGYPSIRFDFSGLGDSSRAGAGRWDKNQARAEISLAVDEIQRVTGCREVVLFGACSGTDPSLYAATVDQRVVGLMLLDPFSYVNFRAKVVSFLQRLRGHLTAGTFTSKLFDLAKRASPGAAPQSDQDERINIWTELRPKPPREEFAATLVQSLQRGCRALLIFTDRAARTHNYQGQLKQVHPELRPFPQIEDVILPNCDHTCTRLHMQDQLADVLLQWLKAGWPPTASK